MDIWFENIVKNYYNPNLGFKWRDYRVSDLNFNKNSVTASVNSEEEFYNVTITFRQFNVHQKDRLTDIACEDNVREDLIRGRIPDVLFESGVDVFPTSSIDFIVDCSCWSNGFLCNESVAVLNRLSSIFKNNPFLIFSLRGLDLTNIDRFPVKGFNEIFNCQYNFNLKFLLDDYLDDYIGVLMCDLEYLIEDYDFKPKKANINLPLNLNSNYQIVNDSLKDEGDLISYLISSANPLLDYTFNLIKNDQLVPEIFKISEGHVYARWIPDVEMTVDIPDELVRVNGKSISETDQLRVFISLIVEDLMSLLFKLEDNEYYLEYLPQLLFKSSAIDSEYKKSLLSDISRNLSLFNIKYDYQLNITNDDEGFFVLELECGDDMDKLRYSCHIRKLFNYFKYYWTLDDTLRMDDYYFLKYHNKIEGYLDDLNVNVTRSFNIYDTTFRIRLTLDDNDYLTINNISSSQWMIDLGNTLISTEEFMDLDIDNSNLLRINDDFYIMDQVKFKSLKSDILFLPTNFESYELLQIALLGRYRNLKFDVDEHFKQLTDFQAELSQPTTLKGTLRPYQITGYSWLVQNIKSGFGSILADDMGLGKTIQVLATILYLKENSLLNDRQVLIVAPTTLITNWANEIDKFTSLTYNVYHGLEREFDDEADVILTSYGMIRSDEEKFKDRTWFLCVVDEAQNIKNPTSKQTRAIKNIPADNRIALTGTPIENRLLDYWSIFDFTNKGYLKSRSKFNKEYVLPVSKNPNSRILDNLKTITRPFILRRLKTDRDIIEDLPDKIVNEVYCNLTDRQLKLYDKLVESGLSNLEEDNGIKRKGQILKLITSLKQICNHPVQYQKKGHVKVKDSSKLELLMDMLSNILEMDEKVIIFTQYVEMGKIIRDVCLKKFNREILFLHGSLNSQTRDRIIDNFQNDKSYPILIATLKTGGVGLNLTSARNVIHYDLWWNPAVENQATDRTYRIGQDKDVMVYRFITKGTLEEKIDLILKDKLELVDRTITSGETFITELSDDELKEMLELRL